MSSGTTMLTASQVARQLGISARKVYSLRAEGKLAGYLFGRAVRFDPVDVEAYRASCRSSGTRAIKVGATSSTVSLKVGGSELAAYFRKAGLKPRPRPSSAPLESGV